LSPRIGTFGPPRHAVPAVRPVRSRVEEQCVHSRPAVPAASTQAGWSRRRRAWAARRRDARHRLPRSGVRPLRGNANCAFATLGRLLRLAQDRLGQDQTPLPHRHPRNDRIDQMRRGRGYPLGRARRANPATVAGKGDEIVHRTVGATRPGKPVRQIPYSILPRSSRSTFPRPTSGSTCSCCASHVASQPCTTRYASVRSGRRRR
jgi:hypothetical protein